MIVCGMGVGLVNVSLLPLGLRAMSGSGPGLVVPPLGWALTVPSGIEQTDTPAYISWEKAAATRCGSAREVRSLGAEEGRQWWAAMVLG